MQLHFLYPKGRKDGGIATAAALGNLKTLAEARGGARGRRQEAELAGVRPGQAILIEDPVHRE